MLFLIAFLLFMAWVLALAFKITVGAIHFLLVAAILAFIAGFARGRTAPPRRPVI